MGCSTVLNSQYHGRPGSSEVPRNPLTRWDVSSIPANGIFLTKKQKNKNESYCPKHECKTGCCCCFKYYRAFFEDYLVFGREKTCRVSPPSASGNLFKCHEEVLYLQPLIPRKHFDIFFPLTGGF